MALLVLEMVDFSQFRHGMILRKELLVKDRQVASTGTLGVPQSDSRYQQHDELFFW